MSSPEGVKSRNNAREIVQNNFVDCSVWLGENASIWVPPACVQLPPKLDATIGVRENTNYQANGRIR